MSEVIKYDISLNHNITSDYSGIEPVQSPQQAQQQIVTKSKGSNSAKLVVVAVATKAGQQGVSSYGQITGDYVTQAKLTEGVQGLGMVAAVAKGGVLGVAGVGLTLGTMGVNQWVDIKVANQKSQSLRERTGMSTSGGR